MTSLHRAVDDRTCTGHLLRVPVLSRVLHVLLKYCYVLRRCHRIFKSHSVPKQNWKELWRTIHFARRPLRSKILTADKALGGSVPRSKKRSVHVRRHIRNRPDFVRFAFSNIFYTDDFPSQGRRRSPLLAPKKPPEAQKLIFLILVVLKPTMERFSCKKIPGAGIKKRFSYGGT